MESFYNLFCVFGVTSAVDDMINSCKIDILSRLPPEIATKILRLLPDKDLVNAASVNKTWLEVCRYDRLLSKRIHSHLKVCRKSKMKSLLRSVRHTFRRPEQGKPFSVLNCLRQATKRKTTVTLATPAFRKRKYEDVVPSHVNNRNQEVRVTRMRI